MKALICGGSGFVGQHLNRRLLAEGHTVRIYDKVLPKEGAGYVGDIKDLELLMDAMRGSDVVYHLASNADIAASATNPTIDFYEGTLLTQNVLEAMRITSVRRIVYFSGSGVYGEDAGAEFHEDHGPLLPISTYGASKLACEALICSYCHMFGMEARVFRPANIVGPGQTHGVGLDFMRRLVADPTHLHMLGNGTQTKSYVHIDDVLDAVALTNGTMGYKVFNVATDDQISVMEIARIAIELVGARQCVISGTGTDRGWAGDVPCIKLDCGRLKNLGWRPAVGSFLAIHNSLESLKHEIISRQAGSH